MSDGVPLLGAQAEATRERVEGAAGMRCYGCRRQVEVGFAYTFLGEATIGDDGATASRRTVTVCLREDCDANGAILEDDDWSARRDVRWTFRQPDLAPSG